MLVNDLGGRSARLDRLDQHLARLLSGDASRGDQLDQLGEVLGSWELPGGRDLSDDTVRHRLRVSAGANRAFEQIRKVAVSRDLDRVRSGEAVLGDQSRPARARQLRQRAAKLVHPDGRDLQWRQVRLGEVAVVFSELLAAL